MLSVEYINGNLKKLKIYAFIAYFNNVFYMLFILIWLNINNISIAQIFAFNLMTICVSFIFNNLFSKLSDKLQNRFIFLFLYNFSAALGLFIVAIDVNLITLLLFAFLLYSISGESFIVPFFYDIVEKREELVKKEKSNFEEKKAKEFSKFRIMGSLGWALGAPIAGLLLTYFNSLFNSEFIGFQILFLISAFFHIFIAAYLFIFMRDVKNLASSERESGLKENENKTSIFQNYDYILLIVIMSLFEMGFALSFNIKTVYATELGGSYIFVGLLAFTWAIFEIPLFFISSKITETRSYKIPIVIAIFFVITKYIFYIFIITPNTILLFLALEILNPFGILWPAITYAINHKYAKENKGFGTSFYMTIIMIARFFGNLLGLYLAMLYNIGGNYQSYQVLFIFGLFLTIFSLVLLIFFHLISKRKNS